MVDIEKRFNWEIYLAIELVKKEQYEAVDIATENMFGEGANEEAGAKILQEMFSRALELTSELSAQELKDKVDEIPAEGGLNG